MVRIPSLFQTDQFLISLYYGLLGILILYHFFCHKKALRKKWVLYVRPAILIEILLLGAALYLTDSVFILKVLTRYEAPDWSNQFIRNPCYLYESVPKACLLFSILLLYLKCSRKWYLILNTIPLATAFLYFHTMEMESIRLQYAEMNQYPGHVFDMLMPEIHFSAAMMCLLYTIILYAPFVLALFLTGFYRSRWHALLLLCPLSLASSYLLFGHFESITFRVIVYQTVAMICLGLLIVEMPHIRRSLRVLLYQAVKKKTATGSFVTEKVHYAGFVYSLVLGAVLPFIFLTYPFFNRIDQWLKYPNKHYKSEIDGYEYLKMTQMISDKARVACYVDAGTSSYTMLFDTHHQDEIHKVLQNVNRNKVMGQMNEFQDLVESVTEMSKGSDYISTYHEGDDKYLNFGDFRGIGRIYAVKMMLALDEDDYHPALAEVEKCCRLGSFIDDGGLIILMMGVAIRNYGLASAWNYLVYYQNDQEALREFAFLLNELAPSIKVDYPIEKVKWNEKLQVMVSLYPFLKKQPVDYGRSELLHQKSWWWYDQIQLTTTLLLYRHDRGEWPEILEELVPEYLEKLPRDPLNGKPYLYLIHKEGIELQRPLGEDEKLPIYEKLKLPFPVGEGVH